MRILLANPPWIVDNKKGVRAGSRWPHLKVPEEEDYLPFPFFLAYTNNLLKKNGFETKIIDAIAEEISYNEFYEKIKTFSPDLIVLEISTPSLVIDIEIIKKIKSFSKAKIAVCGMIDLDKDILKKNKEIDFALIGEYEFTCLELAQKFKKKDFKDIKGIIYKKEKNIIKNQKKSLHKNLDNLPWPYSEELPMTKYHDCPGGIPVPSAQIWASRGCPFSCTFCAWPQLMYKPHSYRTRSIKDIVDEIEFLKKKGFKSFYFDDDTFNVGKSRMIQLCEEIKNRKINLPWAIMARADLMDKEILLVMRKAGLHALKYGVESSSQELLDNCNKKLDIKKAENNILLTKKIGIKVHLTFTFGLLGENKRTIKETIKFALKMDPESVQFSITTPFPGTKYYQEVKKKGCLVSSEELNFDGNFKAMIKTNRLSPEDLEIAVRDAYKIWDKHKKMRKRYKEDSPIKLFKDCLNEHGIVYTIKKTILYMKNKNYYLYKKKIHKNKKREEQSDSITGPEYVTIDLTNKCNLNCIGCWTFSPLLEENKPSKEWFNHELSFQKIKELVEELSKQGTKEIRITGGGEPFLHKNIYEIIKLIKNKGMKCFITTNFTLLNKEKIRQLVDLEIDNITVSIWAGDNKTYAKTHPNKTGKTFERIKEHLLFLDKIRKNTKIVIANVIFNKNYKNLENMVLFGEEINADEIYFTLLDPIKGATDKLLLNEKQRKELLNQLLKLKKRNNKIKIDTINNLIRRISNKDAEKGYYDSNMIPGMKCHVGWLFARIMANGDVAPCCRAVNNITGNLYQQSFKEIWNSKSQKIFRENGLKMTKEFTSNIGCYKTCDNWWQNAKKNSRITKND